MEKPMVVNTLATYDGSWKLPGMNYSLRKLLKLDSLELRFNVVGQQRKKSGISVSTNEVDSDSESSGDDTKLDVFYQSWDDQIVLSQHAYEVWDPNFGLLTCTARWMDVGQVRDRFLSGSLRRGKMVVEEVVQSQDVNFSVRIIWIFDQGRHTRRMEITNRAATLRRQLVYDAPVMNSFEGVNKELEGTPVTLAY
ncbi:hypothetical protein ACLMJK_000719 [Lecanora helva]